MDTSLSKFDENEYKKQGEVGGQLCAQATELEVVDDSTFQLGGELLQEIKAKQKAIEPQLEEPVKKAHELHKWLTGLRNKVLDPFRAAEVEVKRKLGAYQFEQEEKRRKEAEKLAAQARQKAEEARKQAVLEAKKAGDREAAKELANAPLNVEIDPSKLNTPEPPKIAGTSFRQEWDFTVVDPNAIPRRFLVVDESAIRKVVKALGKNHGIPGIAVSQKAVVSSRGA